MENTNWSKQTLEQPLFGDLLWSKPQNRAHAGKLLIVGGNLHSFATPAMAFSAAQKAGAGSIRILLPEAIRTQFNRFQGLPLEIEYAISTPSGSFARRALDQLLEAAGWADGVLLAGDFGRNSETAILLESFADNYKGQLTLTLDSLDYFLGKNSLLFSRPDTLVVIDFTKLQKLAINNRPIPPLKHSANLHQVVEILAGWSRETKIQIITSQAGQFIVASEGKISTTPKSNESNWQIQLAAYASVWQLQQPGKPFEALTTAAFDHSKSGTNGS